MPLLLPEVMTTSGSCMSVGRRRVEPDVNGVGSCYSPTGTGRREGHRDVLRGGFSWRNAEGWRAVTAQSRRWTTTGPPTPPPARSWAQRHGDKLLIPVVVALGIAAWAGLVAWRQYPIFILPGPEVVWRKLLTLLADGSLLRHAQVTLTEVGLGLGLGLTAAFALGYLLGKHPTVERLLAPYLVASQSVPIVAVAPLLVIWFGSGLTSKVLVCALITFFPTLVNTMVGVRQVDEDLRDLLRSLRAGRWQTFRLLELPAALPVIFGGLKLSVILAVVGAVVGEFVGADAGLGYLINLARGILDTPLLFVAVLALVVIAQLLYLAVAWAEYVALRWQR